MSSASESHIQATTRTEFGKGAARRTRRDGQIPAVIYGHGNDPVHITLPSHQTTMAIKHLGANAVLDLSVDGAESLALVKALQVDPIKRVIEHIDFVVVIKGEKVTVDVPVLTVGDAEKGTMVQIENNTISLEAEATHIPESVEVNIEGLPAGTQILASQLVLPKGSSLLADADLLIINITGEVEADLGEIAEVEGAEGAEGAEAPAAE
jgi:large subunit ribosomal protein L25